MNKKIDITLDELDEKARLLMEYLKRYNDRWHFNYNTQRMKTIISFFKLYWMGSENLEYLMQQMDIQDYKYFTNNFRDFINIDDLELIQIKGE